jgi:hypothetical protein
LVRLSAPRLSSFRRRIVQSLSRQNQKSLHD